MHPYSFGDRAVGVTGHRTVSDEARDIVRRWVRELPSKHTLFHGCCEGVDAIAALTAKEEGHTVVAVVPASRAYVSVPALYASNFVIYAPPGRGNTNDYRARNELLVYQLARLEGELAAFWNGSTRSGTSMTINIAKRANVPVEIQEISNA